MRHSAITEAIFLLLVLTACLKVSGAERDHGFKRGRGLTHGNQQSERPGRVGVGREAHAGNGCPAGTMRVVFAPDLLSFTMLFDQFIAQVDPGNNVKRDQMNCDTVIPLTLPDNMQMEITHVDFRGFVALPDRAKARVHSMFNFRGRGGNKDRINMRFDFQGPSMEDYEISSDTIESNGRSAESEVSPCGGDVELRVATRLMLLSPGRNDQATITLDSIDGASEATYYVNWRTCRKKRA